MKITGFRPLIVTKDAEATIKLFEDLGFEVRHTKTDVEGGENINYAMKDADGHRVNIASSDTIPQTMTAVSLNVDNFQEAYDFLIARGFVNPRGDDRVTDTSSSRATMLFSPSGFPITISEHLKD